MNAAALQLQQMEQQHQAQMAQQVQLLQDMQVQLHNQQQAAIQAQHVGAAQLLLAQQQLQQPAAAAYPAVARPPQPRIAPPAQYVGAADTIDEFVPTMTQQFEFYAFTTEAECLRFAASLLGGPAREWWQSLGMAERPASWADMITQLRTRFQPVDQARTARTRLYALRQGSSSINEYVAEFRRTLLAITTMSNEDQLHLFQQGLNASTSRMLNVHGVATLNDAITMAVRIGAHAQLTGAAQQRSGGTTAMDVNTADLFEQDAAAAAGSSIQQQVQQAVINAMQQQDRRQPGSGQYGRGGQGAAGGYAPRPLPRISHLSEAQVKEYMATGKCFGCASKDHGSRECPRRKVVDGKVCWPQSK